MDDEVKREQKAFIKEYNKFIDGLSILTICLTEHHFDLKDVPDTKCMLKCGTSVDCEWERIDKTTLKGICSYNVAISLSSPYVKDDPHEGEVIGTASGKFKALYETKEEVSDEIMDRFLSRELLNHVWPYVRCLTQSDTTLAGLPALTLPLIVV